MQGGVRAMEVVVMKVVGKEGGSMATGVIRTSISPLTGDGLDEAFGLAVGLKAIGFGEKIFEAELKAGGGPGCPGSERESINCGDRLQGVS